MKSLQGFFCFQTTSNNRLLLSLDFVEKMFPVQGKLFHLGIDFIFTELDSFYLHISSFDGLGKILAEISVFSV